MHNGAAWKVDVNIIFAPGEFAIQKLCFGQPRKISLNSSSMISVINSVVYGEVNTSRADVTSQAIKPVRRDLQCRTGTRVKIVWHMPRRDVVHFHGDSNGVLFTHGCNLRTIHPGGQGE